MSSDYNHLNDLFIIKPKQIMIILMEVFITNPQILHQSPTYKNWNILTL